ncbi:MAG: hypothetical protein FWD38_08195 [Oscillospiraceae bacterium]|nr:hypothetical protein [Oscillospiraceae bacterium]
MTFCKQCGNYIEPGDLCDCIFTQSNTPVVSNIANEEKILKQGNVPNRNVSQNRSNVPIRNSAPNRAGIQRKTKQKINSSNKSALSNFVLSLKNRMGIGEPERNATDCYERGIPIVPNCIKSNENEIPVKQYNIAILRNLFKLERAEGRLQVTNNRVIFRAVGRSIGGRTTLQQEFALNELSGIEAHRNYRFGFIYLLFGIIVVTLMIALSSSLFISIDRYFYESRISSINNQIQKAEEKYRTDVEALRNRFGNPENLQPELDKRSEQYDKDMQRLRDRKNSPSGFFGVVNFLIGLAGLLAFFFLYRKWLLKLVLLGISSAAFMPPTMFIPFLISYFEDFLYGYNSSPGIFTMLFGIITLVVIIVGLALYSLKPNLILLIKTKGGLEGAAPIRIKHSSGFWIWKKDGGIEFSEVFPTNESENAIREINAIISDIQKLGDYGIQKWANR